MRSLQAIAIAAIILAGFGVKLFLFTPSAMAEGHGVGVDVSRMAPKTISRHSSFMT